MPLNYNFSTTVGSPRSRVRVVDDYGRPIGYDQAANPFHDQSPSSQSQVRPGGFVYPGWPGPPTGPSHEPGTFPAPPSVPQPTPSPTPPADPAEVRAQALADAFQSGRQRQQAPSVPGDTPSTPYWPDEPYNVPLPTHPDVVQDQAAAQAAATPPGTPPPTPPPSAPAPTSQQYRQYLKGFDFTKLDNPAHKTIKYVAARIFGGFAPTTENLPAVIAALRAQGINATQVGHDKIDFGDGYGPIDVIEGAAAGGNRGWIWLPVRDAGGVSAPGQVPPPGQAPPSAPGQTPFASRSPFAVSQAARFPWSTGATFPGSIDGGPITPMQGAFEGAPFASSIPGYQPFSYTKPEYPALTFPSYTAPTFSQFQAPDWAGTENLERGLLQSILQSPESLSPLAAAQLKETQKEAALSMQQQVLQQIAQDAAARGTFGGGYQASQERRTYQDALSRVLEGNRAVDLYKAERDRQDQLSALATARATMEAQLGRAQGAYATGLAGEQAQAEANRIAVESQAASQRSALEQVLQRNAALADYEARQAGQGQFAYQAGVDRSRLALEELLGREGAGLNWSQLGEQARQFNRRLGFDYTQLDLNANQIALMAALGLLGGS